MKKKVFLTIDLSEDIKNSFRDQEKRWKNLKVFWIGFSSLHLTMEYFGIIDKPELIKIKKAIERTSKEIKPFTLNLDRIVLGPNPQEPKMFWAVLLENKSLIDFQKKLKQNLLEEGYEEKIENFTPHIVLAAAKGNQLKGKKTNVPLKGKIKVEELNIMIGQTYSKSSMKYKLFETFKLSE